ncbi:DUF6082 family protein [Streptomyces coeruleorubidus]
MDDPELAEVLDAYNGTVSPRKLRQFLFANALSTNALCSYRMGNMNREESFGFMPWPTPPRTRTSGGLWVSRRLTTKDTNLPTGSRTEVYSSLSCG